MDILVAVLIGSIVFLSALLIGMALMMRNQWGPENSRPGDTPPDESKRHER